MIAVKRSITVIFSIIVFIILAMVIVKSLNQSSQVPYQQVSVSALNKAQQQSLQNSMSAEQRSVYLDFFPIYSSQHTIASTYVLTLSELEFDLISPLILTINYPNLDYGRALFMGDTSIVESNALGDELPFASRDILFRLPSFELTDPNTEKIVIFQIIDTIESDLDVRVFSKEDFHLYAQRNYLLYGVYFGFLILLIVGSLYLVYFTREMSFLWYSIYLICAVLFLLSANGLGQMFLWSNYSSTTRFSFWATGGMAISITLFARNFIGDVSSSSWFWIASKANLCVILTICLALLFIHHGALDTYFFISASLQMLIVLSFAIQVYLNKKNHTVFLIIGYLVLFPALLFSILKFSGILQSNQITNHSIEFSLLAEALIFSMGLGYKLRKLTRAEREVQRTRKKYLAKLMIVREKEKRDMGVYLHNSVAQLLALIQRKLIGINEITPQSPIKEASHLADQALQKIRAISHDTYPHALAQVGLSKTIQQYAETHLEQADIDLKIDFIDREFDQRQSLLLYRIIQECINNVIRHANASRIVLSLKSYNGRSRLSVSDDGNGFKPEESGFGIATVREYAEELGGNLDIHTEINRGSTIVVEF